MSAEVKLTLADLKQGDKFIIEGEIAFSNNTYVGFMLGGGNEATYHKGIARLMQPISVTPKPIEPQVGQTWKSPSGNLRRIVAISENQVMYCLHHRYYVMPIEDFKKGDYVSG